jgi:DNA-binding NarL/FixJ family response regulator
VTEPGRWHVTVEFGPPLADRHPVLQTDQLVFPMDVTVGAEPGRVRDELVRALATCPLLRVQVRVAGIVRSAGSPPARLAPAGTGPSSARTSLTATGSGRTGSAATGSDRTGSSRTGSAATDSSRTGSSRTGLAATSSALAGLADSGLAQTGWRGGDGRRPGLVVLCSASPAREVRRQVATGEGAPILVVSGESDEGEVVRVLQAGATSYLVDGQFGETEVLGAALGTAAGRSHLSPSALAAVVHRLQHPDRTGVPAALAATLSRRERQIMELVAEGSPNSFIARREFIAEKTVRNHLNNIYAKLHVRSRAEAILVWLGRARPMPDGPPGS